MRIGIITDETATQPVGFGTYTLSLVKSILILDKKNEYYLIHRRKEDHEIYRMAKEIIIPYNPRFPFSTIRNFITLPLKLRKYDLDITHHMTSTGPFVFKHLLKGKAVETIHEIVPILYPEYFERPVRLVFRHLLPRIARNCDYIFTACNSSKNDIVKHLKVQPERVGIVLTGANPIFKPLSRNACSEKVQKKYGIKDKYIIFVSTLEAKKNIPTLLNAYKTLKEKGFRQKLVLIGKKGFDYGRIAAEIRRLGLEKDVVMPGYVPLEDLPVFYNAADVFVFPSPDGFSIPVVEALKCGCPVVVSDEGGGPEVVENSGKVVGTFDADGYAKAIAEILSNKKLAATLRKKGMEQAKKFSWDQVAKKTIAAYNKLVP